MCPTVLSTLATVLPVNISHLPDQTGSVQSTPYLDLHRLPLGTLPTWDTGTLGPEVPPAAPSTPLSPLAVWLRGGACPHPLFFSLALISRAAPTDLMLHSPAPLQPKLHITLALLSVHVQTGTIPVGMRPREHATPTRVPQATLHPPYHSDSHPIWPQVLLI